MIRKIHQMLFPLSLRTALGQSRNNVKQWWWGWPFQRKCKKCCHQPIWRAIRRKVSTAKAHRKRQARLRALLEGGNPINVVFEVTGISKRKADSELRLMMGHPRFNPIVWHVPYAKTRGAVRDLKEQAQCREYFTPIGAKLVDYASLAVFPASERPDIIFPNEPYDLFTYSTPHNKGLLKYLFCYLPYSMTNSFSKRAKNQIIPNGALFFYMESEAAAAGEVPGAAERAIRGTEHH